MMWYVTSMLSFSLPCLSYNAYDFSPEDLVLDQLIVPLVNWYFSLFNQPLYTGWRLIRCRLIRVRLYEAFDLNPSTLSANLKAIMFPIALVLFQLFVFVFVFLMSLILFAGPVIFSAAEAICYWVWYVGGQPHNEGKMVTDLIQLACILFSVTNSVFVISHAHRALYLPSVGFMKLMLSEIIK